MNKSTIQKDNYAWGPKNKSKQHQNSHTLQPQHKLSLHSNSPVLIPLRNKARHLAIWKGNCLKLPCKLEKLDFCEEVGTHTSLTCSSQACNLGIGDDIHSRTTLLHERSYQKEATSCNITDKCWDRAPILSDWTAITLTKCKIQDWKPSAETVGTPLLGCSFHWNAWEPGLDKGAVPVSIYVD